MSIFYKRLRSYLVTGLVVWVPIWATLMIMHFVIRLMDNSLSMLPASYHPDHLLGLHIPGFGIVIAALVILLTGVFATNFIGKKIVQMGDTVVAKIPLVSTIYHAVKQVIETLFADSSKSFRHVLLIEYPRRGIWSIGFQTGGNIHEIQRHADQETVMVFIPTTPNPTSGFIMAVPKDDVTVLDMSVDEALKMVISLGVVQPDSFKLEREP